MAVSGKTATYQIPHFLPGDSPPDMAAVTKTMAERVETLLAKGGDASIAADGTITIGAKKVTGAKIADELKPSTGAAAGTEALRALGTSASTAAAGNDSRLSDERTPKANSVNSAKIENGTVTDADLESPNNAAYRSLFRASGATKAGLGVSGWILTNGVVVASGASTALSVPLFYFDNADYVVSGKTQKLRLRAQIGVNATKPTIKFTVGLYPLSSVAGGANEVSFTLEAAVASIEFNEPAASTLTQKVSADFAIPANGPYVLGMLNSGVLTTNSAAVINAEVQSRHV